MIQQILVHNVLSKIVLNVIKDSVKFVYYHLNYFKILLEIRLVNVNRDIIYLIKVVQI